MRFRLLPWLALTASLCACEDRFVREWRPEDHVPPQEQAVAAQEAQSAAAVAEQAAMTPEERETRAATMLFGMSCASCHGAEGRGDGPARPPMARIANMADSAWQSSRTDEAIAAIIVQGRGMMPAFGTQLPEEAIAALVRHVRSLGPDVPAPATP